jgi:hypothetical protein
MNVTLARKLSVVGLVLLFASACSKTPTQPVIDHPLPPAVTLSNVSGHFVGVIAQLCPAGGSGLPVDDLTLNYQASGASIANASIVACDSPSCETSAQLGTVTECPAPPDPCAAGMADAITNGTAPACFTGDPMGSGSLHILTAHAPDSAAMNLRVIFEDTGEKSNVVSATIDQPQDQVAVSSDGLMSSARFAHRVHRVHR